MELEKKFALNSDFPLANSFELVKEAPSGAVKSTFLVKNKKVSRRTIKIKMKQIS